MMAVAGITNTVMAANDVLDIICETAGISFIGQGVSGRNAPSIRGMNSWHLLMLGDGKRVGASNAVFGHSDFELN
jgi:outer membrane receptor for ferrienterochelin and colicins